MMTSTTDLANRVYGALLGLAYGDAIGFPALFHRTFQFPAKRRDFLWNTNRDLAQQRVIRLTLPFTHRLDPATLEPFPTDDTEYALFTAQTLLAANGRPTLDDFVNAWQHRILPCADQVLTGFSERAAIDNLRRGLLPPVTGNDNPQHYDDSACCRAVAVGLACSGNPTQAATIAHFDAQITNAEDGVYGAQAMAAAVALLAAGSTIDEALLAARTYFPAGSWIEREDQIAQQCRQEATIPQDLPLLLATRLINSVYSYGNAAPETVPAAFALVDACRGDLHQAVLWANTIPKAADSLPALVGALCGAHQGAAVISPRWQAQLNRCRGLCLPFVAGVQLDQIAQALSLL
ncbi:MAG: ADP-ribosylglycohydrolase family protein [Caldilineaceae bacterium]